MKDDSQGTALVLEAVKLGEPLAMNEMGLRYQSGPWGAPGQRGRHRLGFTWLHSTTCLRVLPLGPPTAKAMAAL